MKVWILMWAMSLFSCATPEPVPTNWQKCCVLHTVCISDGQGGPNCDAPEQP